MPTGFEGNNWEDEYYQVSLRTIDDFIFTQRIFKTGPGLVSRPDGSGWKSTTAYGGGDYDHVKYELVDGAWDHDHCFVCSFRFEEGDSLWENDSAVIVCDICHDYILNTRRPPTEDSA